LGFGAGRLMKEGSDDVIHPLRSELALSPSLVILSGAKNLFHYRSGQAARRISRFSARREENRTQ